jgi:hypothetical protein
VLPSGQPAFTRERLVRSVRLFVREGLAEAALLARAPRRMTRNPKVRRAMELAASFLRGRPRASLAEIGAELSRMGWRRAAAATGRIPRSSCCSIGPGRPACLGRDTASAEGESLG